MPIAIQFARLPPPENTRSRQIWQKGEVPPSARRARRQQQRNWCSCPERPNWYNAEPAAVPWPEQKPAAPPKTGIIHRCPPAVPPYPPTPPIAPPAPGPPHPLLPIPEATPPFPTRVSLRPSASASGSATPAIARSTPSTISSTPSAGFILIAGVTVWVLHRQVPVGIQPDPTLPHGHHPRLGITGLLMNVGVKLASRFLEFPPREDTLSTPSSSTPDETRRLLDPQVDQPEHRRHRILRVHRREHQMPRHRRLHRRPRRLLIAYFPDQDRVRVLPQHRPHSRNVQLSLFLVHRQLRHALDLISTGSSIVTTFR